MKQAKNLPLIYILTICLCLASSVTGIAQEIQVGAEQAQLYLPLLQGKKVGIVGNQTSILPQSNQQHLVDFLLENKVNVTKVFVPEHGFRGTADAGEKVNNSIDTKTGLPIVSLYGANKKPSAEQLKDLDVLVFDLQDVGVRFFTYISTLHYVMEACAEQGKTLIAVTITQLLERIELIERAKQTGARIIVPTGALMAFDAVRAASYGTIHSLVMLTRKPPKGLIKAPFVIEQGIDLSDLMEPLCLYKGTVRDAAAKFPANVNVAVALSLAGPGPDHTSYEIWADPAVDRNTHTVKLDSDSTRFEFTIAGVPTEENPATGKLTPLSVMTTLEGLVSTLRIGA